MGNCQAYIRWLRIVSGMIINRGRFPSLLFRMHLLSDSTNLIRMIRRKSRALMNFTLISYPATYLTTIND